MQAVLKYRKRQKEVIFLATCVIFNAGEFDDLIEPIEPADLLLAADGGLVHAESLGLTPDEILGDFDSLGYVPENADVFPVKKDDTDSMLAIRRGLQLGYRRFVLYGSLDGPRLDHTLANFQALQFLADQGAQGWLVGRSYLATVLKNGSLHFEPHAEGILSVFCMGADARGVTIKGLQYPLENGVLTAGFPLGVSNHFTGSPASVTVESGSLLILYDRKNGFPRQS